MSGIESINAREILDSRGNPTVEVEVHLIGGAWGRAGVPSGASTGAYEAHELRDNDKNRYGGKGVQQVVDNIKNEMAKKLKGQNAQDQKEIDRLLNELDGSENKSRLGANGILGVSMACAKASAMDSSMNLFEYIGGKGACRLPVPLMNVINGGAHADNGLDVQEFMIVPICGGSFKEALRAGSEIFHQLKKILISKNLSTGVGDEGGFAPILKSNEDALRLLMEAIEVAGYKPGEEIKIALDVAATELFKDGKYFWEGQKVSAQQLGDIYSQWVNDFPLVSIEDGFSEDDWDGWSSFNASMSKKSTIGRR